MNQYWLKMNTLKDCLFIRFIRLIRIRLNLKKNEYNKIIKIRLAFASVYTFLYSNFCF